MKTMIFLACVFALSAAAQPPPQDKPSDVSDPAAGRVELRTIARAPVVQMERDSKVSGAVAQAARTRNPLKLIDPRARRAPGDGYENVSRDPITGRAQGIRLISFNF